MLIYDGENAILSTDCLLTLTARKGKDFSGVYFRRKSGDAKDDFDGFFLCGYPEYERCKEVVRDIAKGIENGDEIYCIERWTREDAENEKARTRNGNQHIATGA